MTKPNDGGPAFPVTFEDGMAEKFSSGMSLLDWFAGKAISVVRPVYEVTTKPHKPDAGHLPPFSKIRADVIAREAYEIADAMLAEREKRAAGAGVVSEKPGPKFKEKDRVRVLGNVDSTFRGSDGTVVEVHELTSGGWEYDVQLDNSRDDYPTGWRDGELEAIMEEEGETPEAKFKKGDRVRMAQGVMSVFEGRTGIVECAGRSPGGKLTYRINFTGDGGPHPVPQFFETSDESQMEAVEDAGAGGFDSE